MRALCALIVVLGSTASALAQEAPPDPAAHKQILTTNPLLLVGGYLNVEFERRVSESMTLGLTASTFDGFFDDDVRYTTATLIGRYYPQGRPLNGFYLGGKVGLHRVTEDFFFDQDDRDETLLGLGADLGYTWLLGKRDKFVLGLGGGATRLIGNDLDSGLFIPSARINVGIAF